MLLTTKLALFLASMVVLSACTDPKQYPVSGQECGPEDPVLDLDASIADCTPVG